MKESSLLLFLLPFIATAASPFAIHGGGVAGTVAAKSLAALTGMNGSYMALNPEAAGEKLYHLSKEDMSPNCGSLDSK